MTEKQKRTLNISLVPLIIIVGLILVAGYFLMEGEIKLPNFNKGPQVRRLEGFPTIVYTDKQIDKQRVIIKSESDLSNFLNLIDSSGTLVLKEKINFDKEYLIGVSSDTEAEIRHRIKVRKIYEDRAEKTLIVSIAEYTPGKTCASQLENDPNIPVDLVAISKTDWEISFDKIEQVEECD